MKIIFLGSFFPTQLENKLRNKSIGAMSNANNALQWSYIRGLKLFCPSLEVVTLPQIGAFPFRYKNLFFKTELSNFNIDGVSSAHCINFFNLIGFKHLARYIKAKSIISKIIDKSTDNEIVIIIYDLHAPFINAIKKIKEKNERIKTCVIVPDLPYMTGAPENLVYQLFLKVEHFFLNKSLGLIDWFVLLSRHMAEKLPVDNKPWIVIEGIYNIDYEVINKAKKIVKNEKIIFYSGAIDARNGILNLIEAFRQIPDTNYRLIICGDGPEKQYVLDAVKKDSRISYKGQISRGKVLELQKESTLLVNPRNSCEEFTRYSFPSKTMEYFASGVPVLMFEIEGVPDEYYSYCYIVKENSIIGLKNSIMRICEQDAWVLDSLGENARRFILDNKSPMHQCSKLVNFINENSVTN